MAWCFVHNNKIGLTNMFGTPHPPQRDSHRLAATEPHSLNGRRQALKHLALLLGLSLSASSLEALAASFSVPTDMARRQKTLLDNNQLALVRELGEFIIPTTDTPGAIAAGVHDFINYQLAYCFSKADQALYLKQLDRFSSLAQAALGKSFLEAPSEQQVALLSTMEKGEAPFALEDRHFFKQLKALVIFGYYTSEIGASQELKYLPIPGGFKNLKFKDVGRNWSQT
ncbi:conserved hypothetical protein [Cellvibrio japonicus Ueda107]|uniref:Gluconate 2-dehydrogenase subunit 3 family protein n=2 Tax=Cellvibrio japonicus TaxID=155077 RepID=B3PDE2_CELJU|nr:conserved hypothetical protein [Cellvibrio japonicus Ueda107]